MQVSAYFPLDPCRIGGVCLNLRSRGYREVVRVLLLVEPGARLVME